MILIKICFIDLFVNVYILLSFFNSFCRHGSFINKVVRLSVTEIDPRLFYIRGSYMSFVNAL